MRLLGKTLRWIGISLCTLVALSIVTIAVVIRTAWFRDFAREKVDAILAGTFKGQIVVGRIEGSIWGELFLDDISLVYSGDRIAHLDRLRVAYGILSVLRKTIDLTHLDVSGLEINAKQDANGNWNVVEALAFASPAESTSGSKSAFRVLVREISLAGGILRVRPAGGESYALDDVSLEASVYVLKVGIRAKLLELVGTRQGIANTGRRLICESHLSDLGARADRHDRRDHTRHSRFASSSLRIGR
jgi:uncharacterized protein involved in outer membrane biogenesis